MFKRFKKLETSKKLITIVTIVWILSIAIGFIGIPLVLDFTTIINIVNVDFLVILGYYFTKSGAENVTKIAKNLVTPKVNEEGIQNTEEIYDGYGEEEHPM